MAIVKGAAGIGPASDQTLGYGTVTSIFPRQVDANVALLDPSATPFVLLTDKMGSESIDNPKFEWYEKSLRPKATQANGGEDNSTTAIDVDDATVGKINDIVLVPSTGETLVITALASGTQWTVATRGALGSSAQAIGDNADLFIIGSTWVENADVGIPDEWQEVHKYNLSQIFRSPVGASRTRSKTKTYQGDTKAKLRAETGMMHAIDMERAYLFGRRFEGGTGPDTLRRTTGGFTYFATSNVLDLAGVPLSEPDLEGWLEDVFEHTAAGDSRTLFCAPAVISAFDMIGMDKVRIDPSAKTWGLAISQYKTSHGILNLVKHRLLQNGAGGQGWGSWGIAVDLSKIKDKVMDGTKLLVDRQGPGRDGWIDEYLTESGLQLKNPEVHGILKNVGSFI